MTDRLEVKLSRMEWTAVIIKHSRDLGLQGGDATDHFKSHYGLKNFYHSGPNQKTYHLIFGDDVTLAMFKMEFADELNITSNWWMDMANNMISIQPITAPTGQVFRITKNRHKGEE